jgi:hypothetical protein
MTEKISDLRFLAEPSQESSWTGTANGHAEVEIPQGVSSFAPKRGAAPRVEAHAEAQAARGIVFETIPSGGRDLLVMRTPPGFSASVNGRPAPQLAVLEIGDQLRVGDELLHVTRFRRIEAAPPSEDQIGRVCGVCKIEIHAETRIIVHECGALLHLEQESVPELERLDCALVGCQECSLPVEFEAGFVFLPQALP